MGPKPYLTKDKEKELVDFLLNCAKMGYGKTRKEVLQMVQERQLQRFLRIGGFGFAKDGPS